VEFRDVVQSFPEPFGPEAFSVKEDTRAVVPDATRNQPAAIVRGRFRFVIMREEWQELEAAMVDGNVVDTVDALVDLIYTAVGSLLTFVGPERAALAWNEVHRSNMAKLVDGPVFDGRGKLSKPEGWEPPDIAAAISPIAPCPRCGGSEIVAGPNEYETQPCPWCTS